MFAAALKALLTPGAIGVIPTDTVYGVVARAARRSGVARLYRLKHREHKPGTIIAANIDQLVELGIKRRYLTAVEQFWPGAVSVEIPHGVTYLHQGDGAPSVSYPGRRQTACPVKANRTIADVERQSAR